MDKSQLARLSPELRNHIYELCLRDNQGSIQICDVGEYNQLTQTCRQVRSETQVLFYTLNDFHTAVRNDQLERFCTFLQAIGPDVLSQVRALHFRIIEMLPCPGVPLQCSHWIEIRGMGSETMALREGEGERDTKYSIRPQGVETVVFDTLVDMGLVVMGRGSTWYGSKGPTWYATRKSAM